MNRVLIFAEQRQGELHPAVAQLVTAAKSFAPEASIEALVIGGNVAAAAEAASKLGVSKVHVADDAALELYRPQTYTKVLATAVEASTPDAVLLAATFMGRDLAPRVAVRTRGALASDATEIAAEGDALVVKRPVYMGKVVATVKLPAGRLKLISVRPNSFAAAEATGSGEVAPLSVSFDDSETRLTNQEWVSTSSGEKDVTEADIVVSGGRSLKSEENFQILYDLAHVLDGAVGASRAACDAGYQPHSRQVGLTGKTVTPKLYFAFGIDGAIQHLAGMRGSKVIVAINTKKEAPIFNVADYGCVADLFTMAPLLKQEFQNLLGK